MAVGSHQVGHGSHLKAVLVTADVRVRASAPLDPLLPILAQRQLPLSSLLGAVDTASLPLAYEALLELGRKASEQELVEEVEALMGIDKERREMQARETVDEVKPVLEVRSRCGLFS